MQSYKTFTPEQLAKWQGEVQKYMTEIHPTLANVEKWEDMPQEFFNPGCELAKAIIIARDAASNPRQYKPRQAVKVIGNFLGGVVIPAGKAAGTVAGTPAGKAAGTAAGTPAGKAAGTVAGTPAGKAAGTVAGTDDERGAHISEYLYMLPDEVKAMTEKLPELYLQQTALSGDSDDLANQYERAENAGDTELMDRLANEAEPVNRELVQVNQDIRAIYDKADECVAYYRKHGKVMPWEEAQGTVEATTGKAAGTVETGGAAGLPPMGKKPAECTKAEIDAIADPALQHKYEEIRIEANKKYLRRTDLAHTDEWREQVRLRAKELVDWEVKITEKIRKVMELAGVTDL